MGLDRIHIEIIKACRLTETYIQGFDPFDSHIYTSSYVLMERKEKLITVRKGKT